VAIAPGTNLQTVVNAYPGNTTFCIKAGVHYVSSPVTPKTGNIFVGEYGAVLDGTGWTATDLSQAAFRAHNQDIDNVTIRNLECRNMPAKCIHAYKDFADGWLVENMNIHHNKYGVSVGNASTVQNNSIHHNVGNPSSSVPSERGGGYVTYRSNAVVFDNNEIAYNGPEQKISICAGCEFRNNFVHHNKSGIWFDGDNTNSLIESNVSEDNTAEGIFYEVSGPGVIRYNTTSRNLGTGIFISGSQSVEAYQNTSSDDFRGIQLFWRCDRLGETVYADLKNNYVHDNIIEAPVSTQPVYAATLFLSNCTSTQVAFYTTQANNRYQHNAYIVPNLTGAWWAWGTFSDKKTWSQWQALGQDTTGTVSL